jgi:hypothetical protein
VTHAQEAAAATEATRAMAKTSTLEAAMAWESTTTLVSDVNDQAALAEREAIETVSSVEEESVVALAYAREEAEGLVQRIALLEGELLGAHQAQELAEENFQGLCDIVVDAEWRCEESKRESQEQFEELTLL